jgi:hypothetical protein
VNVIITQLALPFIEPEGPLLYLEQLIQIAFWIVLVFIMVKDLYWGYVKKPG